MSLFRVVRTEIAAMCVAPDCERRTAERFIVCGTHWHQLPASLQDAFYQSFAKSNRRQVWKQIERYLSYRARLLELRREVGQMAPISNGQAASSRGDGVPALAQTPFQYQGARDAACSTLFFEACTDALIEHLYDERAHHTPEVR